MSSDPSQSDRPETRAWQPQFGLLTLMLAMLVACMAGAAAAYRMRAAQGVIGYRVLFVFFTLTAPLMLAIVVNLARRITIALRRK